VSFSPIFIVGCPRSGTALLRDLLRSHPNLTFPGESHFIPPFYKAYGDPSNEWEARQLAARVLRLHGIKPWEVNLSPQEFADCRSFRQFVCRLFGAWAAKEGKPRWGDKTPPYLTEMPTLLRLFPEAKIIHIFRDGRDVALSWVRSRYEPSNLYTAAALWQSRVRTGMRFGASLPKTTYLEVRYETLLSDLAGTMREVCEFLGEPFSDAVLRINRLRQSRPHPDPRFAEEVVRTNVEKWKTQMSPSDRVLFESVAGDLLRELGYPVEAKTRRISSIKRLFWKTHHTVRFAARRLQWSMHTRPTLTGLKFRLADIRNLLAYRRRTRS
jgi:hypothetical protein